MNSVTMNKVQDIHTQLSAVVGKDFMPENNGNNKQTENGDSQRKKPAVTSSGI